MGQGGRIVGAAIGAGAVFGIGYWILRGRSSRAAEAPRERGNYVPPPSPAPSTPPSVSTVLHFPPLVERWRSEVEKRAQGLPVDAILEWMRIESGGDMCSVGTATEIGVFQLNFPGDAKYGATLEGLREICKKSQGRNPADISWMTEGDLDMEIGSGIRKILAARDTVRQVFTASGIHWPETSFDFGSAVKQIHATPAVITELVPKISHQSGPPANWNELHRRVNEFPAGQMGPGLRSLALAPSKHGLKNRLEDTLRNAEIVGHAWEIASAHA